MTAPVWAVIPAAGVGRRMQADRPKQYLDLLGRPVLHWTLQALAAHPGLSGIVLAIAPEDHYFDQYEWASPVPIHRVQGGAERSDSVRLALAWLTEQVPDAWAMVHDAVRPCVSRAEVDRLLAEATLDEQGGLLAVPVRDTLKRQTDGPRAAETVSRDGLWQALTPQLFPARTLWTALEAANRQRQAVTDEAQAMELAGYAPRLVEGAATNIKLTRPGDMPLVEAILQHDSQA